MREKSRANGLSRRRDVAQMGCRATGMSRKWNIAHLGCRATEMSRNWNVTQLGGRAIEMSRNWNVAQIKCRSNGCRARKKSRKWHFPNQRKVSCQTRPLERLMLLRSLDRRSGKSLIKPQAKNNWPLIRITIYQLDQQESKVIIKVLGSR